MLEGSLKRTDDPACPVCRDRFKKRDPMQRDPLSAVALVSALFRINKATKKLHKQCEQNIQTSNKAIEREDWNLFFKLVDQYADIQEKIAKISQGRLDSIRDRRLKINNP